MPPGLTSPFTFEERKWIILKFGELKSATLVRRAFQKQFPKSSPRDVPNRKQFQRVLEQFNGSGDVGEAKPKHNVKDSVPQADTDAVQEYFEVNKEAHLRDAVRDLGISLGKVLKWKAYRPHLATILSHDQRQRRLQAADNNKKKQCFFSNIHKIFNSEPIFKIPKPQKTSKAQE